MSCSRRALLLGSLAAVAGCQVERARIAPPAPQRPTPPKPPAPQLAPRPSAPSGPIDIAVVEGADHLATLARALELAGGFGAVKGTVLIKVNTNSGDPYPYSSSPAVVGWLARELIGRGARVVVGDRSFWGDLDTLGNLEQNGIAGAARAAGAEVIAFEPDAVEWEEIAPELVPTWVPPVRVPKLATGAALLINLACLKTHFISGATLSMKNLLGLVHPGDRRRDGNLRTHHADRIHRQIREIHAALPRGLNVIDGHRALVTGGPTPESGAEPTLAQLSTVIASVDRVSCDAFGVGLLRRHAPSSEEITQAAPWQSPILAAARGDAPKEARATLEGVTAADDLLASVNDGSPLAFTRA